MYSRAVSPEIIITGALPLYANEIPPAKLMVPAPEVVMQTEGFPVTLE